MKKIGTKQIVPLCIIAVCVVFLITGLQKFGFWNAKQKSPTAAFVPSIICVLLIVICVITIISSLKESGKAVYHRQEFLMIGTAVAIIAGIYLIGMLPTLAIFTVLWLKVLEKAPWKTTIIILVIVMAIVIGVFVLWLGVRFPQGMLYEMIFKH